MLFFTNACSGISQTDKEILEDYRLKIIGETINLFANNDKIELDTLSKTIIIKHMNDHEWQANDKKLILALVKTENYNGEDVPVVDTVTDINGFLDYIVTILEGTWSGKDKFIKFEQIAII